MSHPSSLEGRLIALSKQTGGIRPIVVGFMLRRLASKCANSRSLARLAPSFSPTQLGVSIPGGCEAAIHSARRFLESMPKDNVVVQLDFSNAFNSLHRLDMLQTMVNTVPELFPFCHSAYAKTSLLVYGQYTILSQEGPQQGDPIGPLLFCNTIQPLLASLTASSSSSSSSSFRISAPITT